MGKGRIHFRLYLRDTQRQVRKMSRNGKNLHSKWKTNLSRGTHQIDGIIDNKWTAPALATL